MVRTASEVIDLYVKEIWNGGNFDLVREICANPITRHDADKITHLTHEEQIARLRHVIEEMQPVFENVLQPSDGTYVTAVWQCVTGSNGKWGCGIEVFKVLDGRITDVWNCPVMENKWA
jgi:hypothetical protein